ncbi:hypothetical protein EJ07DRAFT_158662 [Lizonia empirigonia]|nr:hypothetical protein EJ07DRAFT_158662 [Lizonia empirigonia]
MLRLRESMVLTEQRCRGVTVGYARRARRAMSLNAYSTQHKNKSLSCILKHSSDHGSRPSTSDSTTSVISASDWRKIERLLRGVVEDMYDREAKKLSQTIHTIAVQKTLLQHENERLREALINEKKRRQRGKPLLLEAPNDHHAGIRVWSPSKVQQTRDRQEAKDLEQQQQIHQKAEEARLWNDQKRLKQQLQEERLGRMAAKVRREEAAAVKAREKSRAAVDRELAKQLQDDLQLSKKSKRQSIKVSKSLQLSELPVTTVVDDLVGGEPSASSSAPPTTTTRRGRNIILPSKFK